MPGLGDLAVGAVKHLKGVWLGQVVAGPVVHALHGGVIAAIVQRLQRHTPLIGLRRRNVRALKHGKETRVGESPPLLEHVTAGEIGLDPHITTSLGDALTDDPLHLSDGGDSLPDTSALRAPHQALQMRCQEQCPALVGRDDLEHPDPPLNDQVRDGQPRLRQRDKSSINVAQFHIYQTLLIS